MFKPSDLMVRNQALFSLANDIGCRISEALTLNIGSIHEKADSQGRVFFVITFRRSKTKTRTVISYLAMPYIKRWLAIHKQRDENTPLFLDRFGNRMPYSAASMAMNRALKAARIQLPERKKLHIFRHLFSTRTKNWPRDIKNYWFGWADNANQSQRYTHISVDDLVPHYFDLLEKENNPMLPKQCSCGMWNIGGDFCTGCGKDIKTFNFLNNKTVEDRLAKLVLNELDEKALEGILDKIVAKRLNNPS